MRPTFMKIVLASGGSHLLKCQTSISTSARERMTSSDYAHIDLQILNSPFSCRVTIAGPDSMICSPEAKLLDLSHPDTFSPENSRPVENFLMKRTWLSTGISVSTPLPHTVLKPTTLRFRVYYEPICL